MSKTSSTEPAGADPMSLEIHGNPNAVTNDVGTSSLAQGPSANSCLVEVERYSGVVPPLTVFSLPAIIEKVTVDEKDRTVPSAPRNGGVAT